VSEEVDLFIPEALLLVWGRIGSASYFSMQTTFSFCFSNLSLFPIASVETQALFWYNGIKEGL